MKFISSFFLLILVTTCCSKEQEYDKCKGVNDTTIRKSMSHNKETKSFYSLLSFIEGKKEFSRYNRKHKIDSSTKNYLLLKKVICEDHFNSKIKSFIFDSIYSIRYFMTSKVPMKGTKDMFPKFDITQYNFKTEEEKEIVYKKIMEIGWGDPLKKWNDYYIVKDKLRIIVLQSYVTAFGDIKNKYGKIIEDYVKK